MDLFKVILLIILQSNLLLAQKNTIKEVFPQTILQEDFNNLNQLFPTESSSNKFAIIIDTIGKYFIGTETSQYSMILDWENDLNDFQLELLFELSPEDKLDLFKNKNPQTFGLILKYNPDRQEGLLFEVNNLKKYRLLYITNEGKNKILTRGNDEGWIKAPHLKKGDENHILIKTKNNKFEFYLNKKKDLYLDLKKKRLDHLTSGRFGFNLRPKTKVKIDYIYISAPENYNGLNKLLNLSENEAQSLLKENKQLKQQIKRKNNKEISELKNVIMLLENELRNTNTINDSLRLIANEFQPLKNLITPNKDFIHTLTKELKEQMEKNNMLKEKNNILFDSINILIATQENFKLEYLNILETLMSEQKTDTIKE